MERSTAQRAQIWSTSVDYSVVARLVRQRSQKATGCPQNSSFIQLAQSGEADLLANCYRRSFELAEEKGSVSLAFPSISTGIYGYPSSLAAAVAVNSVRASISESSSIQEVIFCCFSSEDFATYERVLGSARV